MLGHIHSSFLPISVSLSVSLKRKMYTFTSPWLSQPSFSRLVCESHLFLTCWRHLGNIWHWNYFKSRSKFCIIPGFWLSLHEHYHKHIFYHFWIKKKAASVVHECLILLPGLELHPPPKCLNFGVWLTLVVTNVLLVSECGTNTTTHLSDWLCVDPPEETFLSWWWDSLGGCILTDADFGMSCSEDHHGDVVGNELRRTESALKSPLFSFVIYFFYIPISCYCSLSHFNQMRLLWNVSNRENCRHCYNEYSFTNHEKLEDFGMFILLALNKYLCNWSPPCSI